jgi:hypothetical protein
MNGQNNGMRRSGAMTGVTYAPSSPRTVEYEGEKISQRGWDDTTGGGCLASPLPPRPFPAWDPWSQNMGEDRRTESCRYKIFTREWRTRTHVRLGAPEFGQSESRKGPMGGSPWTKLSTDGQERPPANEQGRADDPRPNLPIPSSPLANTDGDALSTAGGGEGFEKSTLQQPFATSTTYATSQSLSTFRSSIL